MDHFLVDDFEFSHSNNGNRINFGTAGDCYSAVKCPQGRFSINLRGSGFRLSEDTGWEVRGTHSFKDIDRLSVS